MCLRPGTPLVVDGHTLGACSPGATEVDAALLSSCDDANTCCADFCSTFEPACDTGLDCMQLFPQSPGLVEEGLCLDP